MDNNRIQKLTCITCTFCFDCRQIKDPIPEFDGDFYMMVQEWIQEPVEELYHRLQYELIS